MKRFLLAAAAAFSLTACERAGEAPEELSGRWDVQQIAGASLGEGVNIWLEIDAERGVISGFTGCNAFRASLSAFSDSLSVGAITEEDAACASIEAATDEARFLGVLPSVQRHIRRGASLELLAAPQGSEALLRLRAVESRAGG